MATAQSIDSLLAPRVNTLAKALTRAAVQYARTECGLSQVEWQVVTLLGVFQPTSIRELAYNAMLDAAQISRAVSALAERGFVERGRSATDSREAALSLTESGSAMNRRLKAAAGKRNARLLAGFSDARTAELFATLDVLIGRAREEIA